MSLAAYVPSEQGTESPHFGECMKTLKSLQNSRSLIAKLVDADWWRVLLLWILTMLLRHLITSLCVVFVLTSPSFSQPPPSRNAFYSGEVLQYKVKWGFIRLGTVEIRQAEQNAGDSSAAVRMSVTSAKGLPFINVNFVNQSILPTSSPHVLRETILYGENASRRTVYQYESKSGWIIMTDSADGGLVRRDTLSTGVPCYDALAMFMVMRMISGTPGSIQFPTLIDGTLAETKVVVTDEVRDMEVDALGGTVPCRRFHGDAQWEGSSFAGMTGAFQGWISDDAAAIPVQVEVNITLGSIVLSLESSKRVALQTFVQTVHASE